MENKTKVYLCGPIAGCTDQECKDWREHIKQSFPQSLDPMRRDYRNVEQLNYREIVELDKRDIRNSDVILVNYYKPSVGTSMEIFYAWTRGIPVVVIHNEHTKLSPWLLYHSTCLVNTLDEAIDKINFIMDLNELHFSD